MATLTFTGTNNSDCKVNGNTVMFPYTLTNGDIIVVKNNSDVDGKFTINGTDYTSNTTLNLQDTDITIVGSKVSGAPVADITITINYTYTSIIKAGTYTFKETITKPSAFISVEFPFISNNTTYARIDADIDIDANALIYYTSIISGGITAYSFKSSKWTADNYRTIIIDSNQTVSDTFFTWFNANIETTVRKSVDLTTLSGWNNLADGTHTITIKAKADGYRDSEASAGVSVTKQPSVYTDCLTFTGENGQNFTLKATNKTWDGTLEYSTDHTNWTTLSAAGVEMASANGKLYLRGSGNTTFYSSGMDEGVKWVLSAKAGCSGNIQTLLQYDNPPTSINAIDCFTEMFYGCTNLTQSPELPATTLYSYCYKSMFRDCVNLITAPELPATKLESSCYVAMFMGCINLKINTVSGIKIFTCPSSALSSDITNMFTSTGGTFTGTPTAGTTYYYTVDDTYTYTQDNNTVTIENAPYTQTDGVVTIE